ncbi:hyalin-like [Glandiceps talaboti]
MKSTVMNSNTQPPVPTCPSDVTQNTDAGLATASVTWTAATATDNLGVTPTSTVTHSSGDNFGIGSTTVTYTFLDGSSNTADCSFTVTVNDVEAPVPTCPSDITQNTDAGLATASVTWTAATATDNSGVTPTSTVTHSSGDNFAIGSTTVTYTFQDGSSNTADCSFTVTVNDIEPPVPTCPSDVTQNTDAGLATASVTWTAATATDNSGVTPTSTVNHSSGDNFAIGSTTVTYTFQDGSSNTADCSFTVTINDVEPPVPTCPSDITQNTDAGLATASITWTAATASDNSGVTPTSTVTHSSGDNFAIGSTTVTYTFQDGSSNTADCSLIVTVNDVELPVPTCPSDITQNTDAGLATASVTWTAATATDNSGVTPTSTVTHSSGDNFAIGSTTVTYTFQDGSSNTADCSFTVTVNDIELPVPTCPSDITQNTDAGLATASVTWTAATATDNSGVTPTSTVTHSSGDNFAIGSTTVTYTFQDGSGNTADCSFTVTVNDVEPPVTTCFGDVTQNTDAGLATASVTWTAAIATDNSGVTPTSTVTHSSGDNFAIGSTTITYTFQDGSSNTADCSFTVTVNDMESPVPTCPIDVTQNTGAGLATASVTWTAATATDNSGVTPTSTVTHSSGDNFGIGSTTVTYTFQDGSGNTADCKLTVMVNDAEPPTVKCPADIHVGNDVSNITWAIPTTTDNSGIAPTLISSSHSPGDSFTLGPTKVTYNYQDSSSNVGGCDFAVTVYATSGGPNIAMIAGIAAGAAVALVVAAVAGALLYRRCTMREGIYKRQDNSPFSSKSSIDNNDTATTEIEDGSSNPSQEDKIESENTAEDAKTKSDHGDFDPDDWSRGIDNPQDNNMQLQLALLKQKLAVGETGAELALLQSQLALLKGKMAAKHGLPLAEDLGLIKKAAADKLSQSKPGGSELKPTPSVFEPIKMSPRASPHPHKASYVEVQPYNPNTLKTHNDTMLSVRHSPEPPTMPSGVQVVNDADIPVDIHI